MNLGSLNQPMPSFAAPVAPKADLPAPKASAKPASAEVHEAAEVDLRGSDDQRVVAIEQAAKSLQQAFPIGDTRFTIFKDATGQYITRFTNLRDGSVTYYPEPELLGMSGNDIVNVSV